MSSRPGTNHLDATAGREVVFCHACNHEWYKDEQPNGSLVCPRCHGEATEIVSPENDPRSIDDGDSDPDEADIDDFRYPPPAPESGAGGFFGRRSVHRGSDRFPPAPFGGSGNNRRTNPGDGADIIRSFQELLGDIGGPGGRPGLQQHPQPYGSPRRVTYQSFSGPNFTGGISSITITGPGSRVNPREPGALAGGDAEFQRVFGDIFRGPPIDHDEHGHDNQNQTRLESDGFPPGGTPGQDRPLDLATALNQLFANLLNPHGTYGDGVYTQEALDRIITNLMEANPQSNAAVPASTQAIETLVRKPLDKEILGTEPKGECTICIDDMLLGDVATFLPCKHWFHEECVVLWLKEHNTCPICRAVIDGGSAQAQGSAAGPSSFPGSSSSPAQPQMTSFWSTSAAPAPPPDWTRPTPGETSAAERRRANFREHGAARLDALRDVGQRDREQEQLDRSPAPRGENSTTNNNYNSNYNNNNNSGNSGGSNGGSSSGSGGPFSWFRDQFRDRRP